MQRGIDQIRAIVKWRDLHLVRQNALDLGEPCAKPGQHDRRIFSAPHEHDAFDGIFVVVACYDSLPRRVALADVSHVGDAHGHAVVGRHAGPFDVLEVGKNAQAADDEHFGAAFDVTAAGVAAGLAQRLEHVFEANPERGHPRRIRLDVNFSHQAAVRDYVGHARGTQDPGPDHPILQRAKLHRVGTRAFERVAIDLADGRCHWAEVRLHADGQLGSAQPLQHPLPRLLQLDPVPSSNVRVTNDRPNSEMLRSRNRPGVPFNARSSGIETRRSTSSVGCPGSKVMTCTWVSVGSGNASTVRSRNAMKPAMPSVMANKNAAMRLLSE